MEAQIDPQKIINRLGQKNAQLTVQCSIQEIAIEDLQAENARLHAQLMGKEEVVAQG